MSCSGSLSSFFFFFNDTATTEIYTLSLHDALPIRRCFARAASTSWSMSRCPTPRSEEHTSELQSRRDLVCRLLLEKKNKRGSNVSLCQKRVLHAGGCGGLWML